MDDMVEKVEVWDKYENTIAIFTKDDENDEDKMINPIVSLVQNGDCTFTFQISQNSKKWEEIQFIENLYVVNGRVFSPKFEDGYVKTTTADGQNLITVTCYERQKSDLGNLYVTAWNSEAGIVIDDFMVVILSGGDLTLKNGGSEVNTVHVKGTAGYILDGILFNTGWSTDTVDVEGTYDFETEQTTIYDNILKVQELFGGILVFDSYYKTISLRDETKFTNYSGYEVRYAKNMESSESHFDNDVITRVIPLGEEGLNIRSVNNDSIYLTNYEYSSVLTERIVTNEDIYEPEQLKRWGQRKLDELSKPRKTMTAELKDFRKIPGYELERFDLNSIVDVINYGGTEGSLEKLRVTSWQYNAFAIYDATIELGDTTLNTTDIFKKISKATNEINNGIISSTKIINNKTRKPLYKDIEKIDEIVSTYQIMQTETNDEINQKLVLHQDGINNLTGAVTNLGTSYTELSQRVDSLSAGVSTIGGNNKQKNSVGAYGTSEFEQNSTGSILAAEEERLKNVTDNGLGRIIYISGGKQFQFKSDNLVIGQYYTVSFKYTNDSDNTCKIELIDNSTTTLVDVSTQKNLTSVNHTFRANSGIVYLRVTTGSKSLGITDYYLQNGTTASKWQPAAGEILGTSVSMYYNGLKVSSATSKIITEISNLGFSVKGENNKTLITFNPGETVLTDTKIEGYINQNGWKTYIATINNKEMKLEVKI